MTLAHEEQQMRDRFLQAMLQATLPLQAGQDQEITLQALIQASELLRECFERELDELRQEAAD